MYQDGIDKIKFKMKMKANLEYYIQEKNFKNQDIFRASRKME